MSRPGRRTRWNRKKAIAKRLIQDETLDPEVKRMALQVLSIADDNGVIYNDDLYAIWKDMGLPTEDWGSRGR